MIYYTLHGGGVAQYIDQGLIPNRGNDLFMLTTTLPTKPASQWVLLALFLTGTTVHLPLHTCIMFC